MACREPPPSATLAAQEAFWRPVGKLVFAFGHLEAQIDWCISALLDAAVAPGDPTVGSQIRNICSRIALVEALFRLRVSDAASRDELHHVIKELGAVIKFRNSVLHGRWGDYDGHGRTWRKPRTHPTDLRPGSFEVSVEAIDEHIARAAEVGDRLVQLVHAAAGGQVAAEQRPAETPGAMTA